MDFDYYSQIYSLYQWGIIENYVFKLLLLKGMVWVLIGWGSCNIQSLLQDMMVCVKLSFFCGTVFLEFYDYFITDAICGGVPNKKQLQVYIFSQVFGPASIKRMDILK